MHSLVTVGSVLTIIAGAAILAWIIGIYAIPAARRTPWIMRAVRRARSAWREATTPVLAPIEKRVRILVSDARAWARDRFPTGRNRP